MRAEIHAFYPQIEPIRKLLIEGILGYEANVRVGKT